MGVPSIVSRTNQSTKLAAVLAAILLFQIPAIRSLAADSPATSTNSYLIPTKGWTCGMPEGIPVPEQGTLVFEASLDLEHVYEVGLTPYGFRKVLIVGGGSFSGEKINGTVMRGGLDFQLDFPNGTQEIEQVLVLKTSDGKYIYVRSAGVAANPQDVRVVPDFEAPQASDQNWLHQGKYVGRRVVDVPEKTMKLSVYDVTALSSPRDAGHSFTLTKPADVKDQPWDYRRAGATEQRGDLLITENVTLGGSQSVGNSKNGGRNIIPITGGTLSGKINGKVLFGGADYQKLANPATLDARYLWQTEEGDVIIVRNAGPISKLVPVFEVRSDSRYAWLNQGTYLSSDPGMGAGGVSLKFYESMP